MTNGDMECDENILVRNMLVLAFQFSLFHQGNATIRSVWGRLHTGSSPAIRTTKQPRDQLPGAVFCLKKNSNRLQTTLIFASKLCIMQFGGENYDFDDFDVAGSIAKIQ